MKSKHSPIKKVNSSFEKKIIEGLEELTEALETNQAIGEKFDCRRYTLELKPTAYDSKKVKAARESLNVSQAIFGMFLGVSIKTVQSWERGDLSPNNMACRFLDEIQRDPRRYRERLEEMLVAK